MKVVPAILAPCLHHIGRGEKFCSNLTGYQINQRFGFFRTENFHKPMNRRLVNFIGGEILDQKQSLRS
jgi:hypothetical protein